MIRQKKLSYESIKCYSLTQFTALYVKLRGLQKVCFTAGSLLHSLKWNSIHSWSTYIFFPWWLVRKFSVVEEFNYMQIYNLTKSGCMHLCSLLWLQIHNIREMPNFMLILHEWMSHENLASALSTLQTPINSAKKCLCKLVTCIFH